MNLTLANSKTALDIFPTPPALGLRPDTSEKPLVLIGHVHDDMHLLLGVLLERWGYNVVEAETEQELLERFADPAASLVLLDTMIPFEETLDLLDTLQQRDSANCVPRVLFSGFAEDSYRKAALEHGATGYLVKPVNLDSLEIYFKSLVDVYRRRKMGGN